VTSIDLSQRPSSRAATKQRSCGHGIAGATATAFDPNAPVPANDSWDLAVVVPAHNEADTIADSLTSILDAVAAASSRLDRSAIIVVADRCADNTASIARQVLRQHAMGHVFECEAGGVGRARHVGVTAAVDLGLERPHRTWIANTDADTTVPKDWIRSQLCDADAGFVAVAGVVVIDGFEVPLEARRRFDVSYMSLLPGCGEHPHVHAANLGVRMDAYEHVGGWGDLDRSEDRDLWSRLQTSGARLTSRAELTVTTSGRATGRVPGGFAHWLHGGFE
jgi:glycosyltransferase involved in cell wall biosynthesis